jgi:hypothetical protein
LNRENLRQLEENYRTFIEPLLSEKDSEDYHFAWEFEKFLHSKTLQVMTSEKRGLKKWKQLLSST